MKKGMSLLLCLLLAVCADEAPVCQETPTVPQTNESIKVFCIVRTLNLDNLSGAAAVRDGKVLWEPSVSWK